jgi:hypothetical protein
MRDLYRNVKTTQIFNPTNSSVARTSSGVDTQGFSSATLLVAMGASGDTLSGSVFWTLKAQHSDDNSSYSDCVAADLLNDPVATYVVDSSTKDKQAYSFGYKGTKRYLRAVATPTGTHTVGTPIGMVALLGDPAYAPVV